MKVPEEKTIRKNFENLHYTLEFAVIVCVNFNKTLKTKATLVKKQIVENQSHLNTSKNQLSNTFFHLAVIISWDMTEKNGL